MIEGKPIASLDKGVYWYFTG